MVLSSLICSKYSTDRFFSTHAWISWAINFHRLQRHHFHCHFGQSLCYSISVVQFPLCPCCKNWILCIKFNKFCSQMLQHVEDHTLCFAGVQASHLCLLLNALLTLGQYVPCSCLYFLAKLHARQFLLNADSPSRIV